MTPEFSNYPRAGDRPTFREWAGSVRAMNAARGELGHFFVLPQVSATVPQHIGAVPMRDGLAPKS